MLVHPSIQTLVPRSGPGYKVQRRPLGFCLFYLLADGLLLHLIGLLGADLAFSLSDSPISTKSLLLSCLASLISRVSDKPSWAMGPLCIIVTC